MNKRGVLLLIRNLYTEYVVKRTKLIRYYLFIFLYEYLKKKKKKTNVDCLLLKTKSN